MAKFIRLTELRRVVYRGWCHYDIIVNLDEISSFKTMDDGYNMYYMLYLKNGTEYNITEDSYKRLQQEVNC